MTLAIRWVGSPNYSPGRDGHNPDWTPGDPNTWIVMHTMVGSMAGTIAAFSSPARQASSTYGVGLDGSIVQFVKEADAAWANGTYADNPGSNLDSISIEHEDGGDYNGPRTPALYEASAQLLADISRRRGIPLIHRGAGGGVLGHKECGPHGIATGCPDGLDVARIIARANEILHPPPPPVPAPTPVPIPPVPTPTPVPHYVAFGRGREIVIASGTDLALVLAAAQAWQDANRGEESEITKDGAHLQTLDPIPPVPDPAPVPGPIPTPIPPPPVSADFWTELQAFLIWLFKNHGPKL